MPDKTLFLLCNAHLDPVWLWEWEEGAAETLSTFRTAAQLCEEFEGFIFNHNEAVLYRWIEEYEPALFERIKKLAKEGRWFIMGGWYLQPDCNLPGGESFVRQILTGKNYFAEKFGVEPKTAINLDPFGHSRGLVQIMRKSGYDSYLFCRPDYRWCQLPGDDFIWVGYDGSEIVAHRAQEHYNSERGKSQQRVEKWLKDNAQRDIGLLLWGIGDHGGGPSREDLSMLRTFMKGERHWEIRHAHAEAYFSELASRRETLPRHSGDLNPWAVGCYASMSLVKRRYRQLENLYFLTEKMVTHTYVGGVMEYPHRQLREALEDLLFCQFHDILPGSGIPQVEEYALRRMDHAMEILSRLRAGAFFKLLSGEVRAEEGEFPIFIYNPHPYPVSGSIVCEFQPAEVLSDKNRQRVPEVKDEHGKTVPCQLEKESSNLAVDWRKRIVFHTELKASCMNRYSCYLREVEREAGPGSAPADTIVVSSEYAQVAIDAGTGLISRYRVGGVDFLKEGACKLLVMEDNADPWGMTVRAFRNEIGHFTLMNQTESARFAAAPIPALHPVRVIEDGPVRTVVEALFRYEGSSACLRYKISKWSAEIEIDLRVFWDEKNRMLKLSLPVAFKAFDCLGQVAYGIERFKRAQEELNAQKWLLILSAEEKSSLTVINEGTYGFDYDGDGVRVSLLRSPAYSGHPFEEGVDIHNDRFEPRIDQGERAFRFWLNAGEASQRLRWIDREALARNEAAMVLCCHPPGEGEKCQPGILLDDDAVQVSAVKMAEKHEWLLIRLFEPTGEPRRTRLRVPLLKKEQTIILDSFEIKTIAIDLHSEEVFEVDLLERLIA